MLFSQVLVLASAIASAVASPLVVRAWPQGDVTCGTKIYTLDKIKAAVAKGFSIRNSPVGSNSYPHKFNNFEGLEQHCTGKTSFMEFPVISSGVYTGGSPGADRVIFSTDGVYCSTVTHTGAGGNNFLSCRND